MNVGEALARALVDEGIDAVFSLLGDGSVRTVYHLAAQKLPVFEGRHEAYVYAMADGYARASGRPTVCAITGGPALAHTLTAMTGAARSGAPVVLLTGPASRDDLGGRQRIDHRAIAELAGAGYFPVHGPEAAVRRAREVMDFVRERRCPAVLDVPEVVQVEPAGPELTLPPRTPIPGGRIHPDPTAVDRAVELMQGAARPVVLAGDGAVASGARDALVDLGDRMGALFATTINARGYFHGHAFDAGVAGGLASQAAASVFPDADLVISFGASMDRFTTMNGTLFPEAMHIVVDVRPPGPMGDGRHPQCHVQGDAAIVAAALAATLEPRTRFEFRTDEMSAGLRADPDPYPVDVEPDRLDPRRVCAVLDELLPPECGWVTGNSGHFWAFPIVHMRRWRQPLLHASGFGAIGYGMSVGLGAALANEGRAIVAFEGDAGAMMHIQALETAARYGAKLLVVVLDDGALGAEYHGMVAEGYDPALSLTPPTDFAGIARSLGCRSALLTDDAELPGLVEEFIASPGPMLIHAPISRKVISRPFRRSTYGMAE